MTRAGERRWLRMSVAVDADVALAARTLALRHQVALSRLVEEALRGYLATRSNAQLSDLLAQTPRRTGRPSRLERLAEARRVVALRRRQGRPLKPLELTAGAAGV